MGKQIKKCIALLLFALIAATTQSLPAEDRQSPPKVGLVLSGGGARGAAHIGVLKVLEREGIPIDFIVGTSFGALAGALYAIGYPAAEIERILLSQDWDSFFTDAPHRRFSPLIERQNARYQAQISLKGRDLELPSGLWGGQRLTETLDILTTAPMLRAQYDFDKLSIPFRAVSTNLIDGKAYVFKQGSMTEALRASLAVPMVFTPLEKDGMLLVDGGLVDNLPTGIARSMGADIIIAVDVTSPLLSKEEIRTFVNVVDQSISLQMERNVEESLKLATIVLKPDLEKLTFNDYDKLPEVIRQGEEITAGSLEQLKALMAGVPLRPRHAPPTTATFIIDSISFRGLENIKESHLKKKLHVRPGKSADPVAITTDVGRLYATRLFDSVKFNLEPAGENRYHLEFVVKENPLHSLGASLRYDNDYDFVALAEFSAHQLFESPSNATISTQFGGLEHHFAALRLIPSSAQFLFIEPKIDVRRLERLDIREKELVDKFTDKRDGGQLMIGGSVFGQLEISGGYRYEQVRISGGSNPNSASDSTILAGLVFRFNRDTLDHQEYPRGGMTLNLRFDQPRTYLGGDFDYSKYQAEYQRYFSISRVSTFQINAGGGYARGEVPFFERFYVGGYSFSDLASRQFLGLERDELPVNQMAIIGASYRRQIFSSPLKFIRRGFLTGIYNGIYYSMQSSEPYEFSYLNGAGIGLALDTMIGPVRLTGGWAEGGRFRVYLSIGPAF
jgi:NTE family protein